MGCGVPGVVVRRLRSRYQPRVRSAPGCSPDPRNSRTPTGAFHPPGSAAPAPRTSVARQPRPARAGNAQPGRSGSWPAALPAGSVSPIAPHRLAPRPARPCSPRRGIQRAWHPRRWPVPGPRPRTQAGGRRWARSAPHRGRRDHASGRRGRRGRHGRRGFCCVSVFPRKVNFSYYVS